MQHLQQEPKVRWSATHLTKSTKRFKGRKEGGYGIETRKGPLMGKRPGKKKGRVEEDVVKAGQGVRAMICVT